MDASEDRMRFLDRFTPDWAIGAFVDFQYGFDHFKAPFN